MTTINSSTNNVIRVFFPDVLKEIWADGKRDWSVYSKEQFTKFWDRHIAEPRKK